MKTDTARKPAAYNMPSTLEGRDEIYRAIKSYASEQKLPPPLTMEELREHIDWLVSAGSIPPEFAKYAMVLLNNEVWRETVAATPYERRLLLLPQCLRSAKECPAGIDEFGLLCEECGRCPIGDLQSTAEDMGYIVLVAEGTTVVTKLLESGKVDTVIGVSCLSALEESFPKMTANAIPGLAVPLHRDGCLDTRVDVGRVQNAINLRSAANNAAKRNADDLYREVFSWFQPDDLAELIGKNSTATESIACEWLARDGKRWRPFLLASVFCALQNCTAELPNSIRHLAVAVECFHKASLVHDDIEDYDESRYGETTVHHRHGVPVALNVGDFLIGAGYRLIAESGHNAEKVAQMIGTASKNHCELSLGQGEELYGRQRSRPFSVEETLDIFRRKTAPAFGVALLLGAMAGDGDTELCKMLEDFSLSLGIAYQIHDDLEEFCSHGNLLEAAHIRPSLLLALAYEQAQGQLKSEILAFWNDETAGKGELSHLRHIFDELMVVEKARQLQEHFKHASVRTLGSLQNTEIKAFLLRLVVKMIDPA